MLKHKLSFEGLDNSIFELVLERKEGNKDKEEIMDYLETQFVNAQKYLPFYSIGRSSLPAAYILRRRRRKHTNTQNVSPKAQHRFCTMV